MPQIYEYGPISKCPHQVVVGLTPETPHPPKVPLDVRGLDLCETGQLLSLSVQGMLSSERIQYVRMYNSGGSYILCRHVQCV